MSSVVADVFGTLGAVFWSVQLLPQIWINYRRPSHTEGLQPSMMLLWAAAAIPLGIYNILSAKSIALQIQPQILAALSLVTWGQVYYYEHHWSLLKSCVITSLLGLIGAGFQLLGILPFLYLREDQSAPHAYLLAMAILSAVGLALGVLRHYWDIYEHRSVRGISFIFVFLDAAGDLTSLISVAVVQPLDVEGASIYAVELVLWIGIAILGVIFNLRTWLRARQQISTESAAAEVVEQGQAEAVETASLSSDASTSTSVFQTVGLRRRALNAIKMRRRTVVVDA